MAHSGGQCTDSDPHLYTCTPAIRGKQRDRRKESSASEQTYHMSVHPPRDTAQEEKKRFGGSKQMISVKIGFHGISDRSPLSIFGKFKRNFVCDQ